MQEFLTHFSRGALHCVGVLITDGAGRLARVGRATGQPVVAVVQTRVHTRECGGT